MNAFIPTIKLLWYVAVTVNIVLHLIRDNNVLNEAINPILRNMRR